MEQMLELIFHVVHSSLFYALSTKFFYYRRKIETFCNSLNAYSAFRRVIFFEVWWRLGITFLRISISLSETRYFSRRFCDWWYLSITDSTAFSTVDRSCTVSFSVAAIYKATASVLSLSSYVMSWSTLCPISATCRFCLEACLINWWATEPGI